MLRRATVATFPRRGGVRLWLVVVLAAVAAACGTTAESQGDITPGERSTVPIGGLPEPLSGQPAPPNPPSITPEPTASTVDATLAPAEPIEGPIGDRALGNRVIMVGDSVLASTTRRFGGAMCDALNTFGWAVEVDAEPGRFVDFAHDVLDQRLRPDDGLDWDVAAVMLGNNYRGDPDRFADELDDLLVRLRPRPTILYTLTETGDDVAALNEIIRDQPRFHPNVVIVDWAGYTAAEPDILLTDDGLHLTEEGSGRLVLFTAGALGEAPGGLDGECLNSPFTDDSADAAATGGN